MVEVLPDSLGQLIRVARQQLAAAGVTDSALDARLLVEHFSGTTRAEAIADPGRKVDAGSLQKIDAALKRRVAGEPAHRIMGFRDFYGLRFMISSETLEPRPDTETLVDAVLPLVKAVVERDGQCRVLDLGTGTGAIALAVLSAVHQARATGVDISSDALTTAHQNAQKLGFSSRFTPLESDWFSNVSGRYHVIVSNPPYIKSQDIDALQVEVRSFDPRRSLDGGSDGLDAYRTIAEGAHRHLEAEGIVAVEIGATQKSDVITVFQNAGFLVVNALVDLAGHDRVLVFRAEQKGEGGDELTLGKTLE